MPRKKPKKLITLDTETYNGLKGDLKRIAIYDGEKVTYGYTFEDVEKELIRWKKEGFNVHCYVHNIEFDIRKISSVFRPANMLWSQTKLIDGKYVIVATKNYTLHDSFRLLPMSLKKLSEEFQIEHGKLDLWEKVEEVYPGQYTDIVDFLDRCHVDDPVYLEYLGYDVISLYEVIETLCKVSGLSFDILTRCMSTASMSKKIFKYGFKGKPFIHEGKKKTDFEYLTKAKWWGSHKPIKDNHSKNDYSYQDIEKMIRESYFGGRTEVFKPLLQGRGEVIGFHMDVNSLYPDSMKRNSYPIGSPTFYDLPFDIEFNWRHWLRKRNGLGFIKCDVYIPKCHIPPLPVKKGKLLFPCGYVSGTWTYNELAHAVEKYNVKILKFHYQIHFAETFPVFENFIGVLSKIKEEAKESNNQALYLLSKLLQNTGYGWTGMNREGKTELQDISNFDIYIDRIINKDDEMGYIEIESIVKSETIQVQIASYVTSYARLKLLEAFEILQEQGAEIYYCDTDSIVSDMLLPEEMLHKSKLGFWDVEAEVKEGIFLQPKVYYEETIERENIKFKGVTKSTQGKFDRKFMISLYDKLAIGEEDKVLLEEGIEVLRSVKYMQKKGLDFNYFETRDKSMNLKNQQKRIMNYIENYTEPHYIESLEAFEEFNLNFNLDEIRRPDGNVFNTLL